MCIEEQRTIVELVEELEEVTLDELRPERTTRTAYVRYPLFGITFRISQEDSYKERTWTPRKRGQSSTIIKAQIPSHIKVRIIYPSLAL